MAKEKCDFDSINLSSNIPNACTPEHDELDFQWRGVRINMPKLARVQGDKESGALTHDSRVPFCLVMQFPSEEFDDIDRVPHHVSVVMVNSQTGESITDNLVSGRSMAPNKQTKRDDDPFQNSVSTKYVNANLVEYLPIPPIKATYHVYALFKTHKSNVVSIEIAP